jgi:hypothetical protein
MSRLKVVPLKTLKLNELPNQECGEFKVPDEDFQEGIINSDLHLYF